MDARQIERRRLRSHFILILRPVPKKGSCFFTMCGQHAFRSSPQEFDAARVSAAIPSGVGFLGSALIWKHAANSNGGHEVHGLTTAASVWLSASIGIGSGGGLFLLSAYATALVIFVLRIGPRLFFVDDASSVDDAYAETEDDDDTEQWGGSMRDEQEETQQQEQPDEDEMTREEERQELVLDESSKRSDIQKHSSSRRSIHGGLQRRRSKASLVTFGS